MKQIMDTPIGVYQVWHKEGIDYHQVAAVKAASLLVAAELTMKTPTKDWYDKNDYPAPESAVRLSRTGDMIVCPDGGAFNIVETRYGFTFEQAEGLPNEAAREYGHATLSSFFAEIRADEAAGKREDAHTIEMGKDCGLEM